MNRLLNTFITFSGVACLCEAAEISDSMARLHWKGDEAGKPVRWTTVLAASELSIAGGPSRDGKRLEAVIFQHPSGTNLAGRPVNQIRLRDGGSIGGLVTRMASGKVEVESVGGNHFDLPETLIRSIRWTDAPAGVSYEGPYTADRWIVGGVATSRAGPTSSEPAWKLIDGVFVSQGKGTLACECDMPPVARVEFDLYWRNRPRFRMTFFQRDMVNYTDGEGFHFFSSGSGSIYAVTRGRDPRKGIKMERRDVPSMVNGNHARLDFRVNSHTGEGWLFADGEEIRHWTDLGYAGAGTGLMFLNYHSETRLGVANVRVSEWDGRTVHAPNPTGKTKTMIFRNGDKTETSRLSMTDTNLTFALTDSRITIPTTRVAQIFLPGHWETDEGEESVWIHFLPDGWMRGRSLAYSDGLLTWQSVLTRKNHHSPIRRIRGLHFRRDKPVMDLSWYLPTMPPLRDAE